MVIRLSFIIFSLSGAVQAESLPDPTRPPGGVDAAAPAAAPSGPALQVIRTFDGKRMAIISGQAVKVGGKVGDAIVTRIDEDRVVLRGAEGVQTLKLFPDVEKSPVASGQIESKPQAKVKAVKDHGKDGSKK
ncbi:MAG: MSHA biogenesis protein MshK [Hydrogenophilales bacterium]|nr:MSHA biogenesis protein MshK [Hydrogenophilales bacterium]